MNTDDLKLRVTCPLTGKKIPTGFTVGSIKEQAISAPADRFYEFICPDCGHPHRMTIQQLMSVIPKH